MNAAWTLILLFYLAHHALAIPSDVDTADPPDTRIVGGEAANPHEFPHQLSLQTKSSSTHFCGAALLNQTWAVSAAHCFLSYDPSSVQVAAGVHDRSKSESWVQKSSISKLIIHEGYNYNTFANDIVLLKLQTPFVLNSNVSGIEFLRFDEQDRVNNGTNATVSGWGTTSYGGSSSQVLRKVQIPVLTDAQCRSTGYGTSIIQNDMICAGSTGKDSCQGDSGGPLIANIAGALKLIGIVSFGNECGLARFPGVYTEVARYSNWLLENMK